MRTGTVDGVDVVDAVDTEPRAPTLGRIQPVARQAVRAKRLADLPDALTVAEAALVLRCGPGKVYKMAREGDLRVLRVRGRLLIPRRWLALYLNGEPMPEAVPSPRPSDFLRLNAG